MPFPDLGDARLTWEVCLTEPEINTIHAMCGFIGGMLEQMRKDLALSPVLIQFIRWAEYYGPTLEALSDRLARDTEGPNAKAPVRIESTVPTTS